MMTLHMFQNFPGKHLTSALRSQRLGGLIQSLFLGALLVFSAPGHAVEPLSDKLIDNWIASQQALETWGKEHEDRILESGPPSAENENPMTMSARDMIEPLKQQGLYDDVERIVKKEGFESLEQWAETTLRITRAAAAVELEAHPEMLNSSTLENMLASPDLPEAQRELLQQAIDHNKEMIKNLKQDVSDSDKNAVRSHLGKIEALMHDTE